MATPESKVKDVVRRVLKAQGDKLWYCMPSTHGYGASGAPDFIGCYRGVFFGIECKAGNNKPTLLQERAIDGINASGGVAIVVSDGYTTSVQQQVTHLLEVLDDVANG